MDINTEKDHASGVNTGFSWRRGLQAPGLPWIAALAVVLFILLHESLIGGKGLVPADGVLNYPPWNRTERPSNYLLTDQFRVFVPEHEFMHQEILRGNFPAWNPRLGCGMPNLGSIQGSLLFPIQLLLSPLDPFYASGPAAFLKLFLAGLFTMLYLRLLGTTYAAAFLSGLVFSLGGFMIVWLGHPHVNCAMWLPLLLYFVEKSFRCDFTNPFAATVLRPWIGFAVAFGFMLLGGHPPTVIHIFVVVICYFLFRLADHRKQASFRRVALLVGAMAAGTLLAAPQLLPYLEYYRESSSALSFAGLQRWTAQLAPSTLIHFFLPHVSGSPSLGFEDQLPQFLGFQEMDNFNERTGYVGIVPLFLGLYAVSRRRCRFTAFYLAVAVVAGLVIYGVLPLQNILQLLPVVSCISQTRLLLFVTFSAAVLAGLGWDTLSRMENDRRAVWVVAGFWVFAIAALVWFWSLIRPVLAQLDMSHRAFLMWQLPVFAVGLIASGIVAVWRGRRTGWIPATICLGWTAADLLWFGMGYNPAIPRDRYYPRTEAIEWLKQDSSMFRVLGIGTVLVPDTAAVFGLSDARGTDFMSVRRYEELITGSAGDFYFYTRASALPDSFRLLNVKYVLTPGFPPRKPGLFELVHSNEVAIYRYKECKPRAMAVFDYQVNHDPVSVRAAVRSEGFDPGQVLLLEEQPERTEPRDGTRSPPAASESMVRITSDEPDDIAIEASLPRPGFLLLLDTYFPGWTASVNGRATRIYRADYNFRAVQLPGGKSLVRFSYRPKSFRLGLALAGASLLALGAAWFWPRKRALSANDLVSAADGRSS
jgi:hypothetical protein